jgi:hypothetical protein
MPFCPSCRVEYNAGILRCAECDEILVEALPDETNDTEGSGLTVLANFPTVAEAEMIQELLERNDVRTILRGEVDPIGVSSRAVPTTILVEERDLPRARELYEAFFEGEGALGAALPLDPAPDDDD